MVHAHEATGALMRCALVVVRESVCLFMVHAHEATGALMRCALVVVRESVCCLWFMHMKRHGR